MPVSAWLDSFSVNESERLRQINAR